MFATLSESLDLWTTTRAHSDDLWMLYLALTGAVLGFSFSSAYQKAPVIQRGIVAIGFGAFAFANLNAMGHNVAFNNLLVEAIQAEVPSGTALAKATDAIHTNPPVLMVVFHVALDLLVLALLLVPQSVLSRLAGGSEALEQEDNS